MNDYREDTNQATYFLLNLIIYDLIYLHKILFGSFYQVSV